MADELTVTTGTTTATAKTAAAEGPGLDAYLNAGAALLWPLLFFCCLWVLRRELRSLLGALAARVADKDSELVVGPVTLRKIESRLESVEADQQVTTDLVQRRARHAEPGAKAMPAPPAEPMPAIPDALTALAEEYLKVELPKLQDRVRRKDELAGEMALMIVRDDIPRRLLAASKNEGILVGLASAIHIDPRSGDDLLIAEAGEHVKRLHVRYRFLMAIARLADRKLVQENNLSDLRALCLKYREGADQPLQDRIKRTLAVLSAAPDRD